MTWPKTAGSPLFSVEWQLNRRGERAIPVAQPSRRRVKAPSRCASTAGGETPPQPAAEDGCATWLAVVPPKTPKTLRPRRDGKMKKPGWFGLQPLLRRFENCPAFQSWVGGQRKKSPGGTAEDSFVPDGTLALDAQNPRLKPWAIFEGLY